VDDNYTIITNEINEHLNEIGLAPGDYRLYRVVGFAEDPDDYYYVAEDIRGKVCWITCVGGFIWLKSAIDERDYNNMEKCFELNKEWYDNTR